MSFSGHDSDMSLWTWILIGAGVLGAYVVIFSLLAVSARADAELRQDARRALLRRGADRGRRQAASKSA